MDEKKQLKIAFVMDPIENVNIDADTTFDLMCAAQTLGHTIFTGAHFDLRARGDQGWGTFHGVEVARRPGDHFHYTTEREDRPLADFDAIFMRTDPPFDIPYLHATHILGLAAASGVFVVNDPTGLRIANEKLYALHFPDLIPETWVTASKSEILQFLAAHDGVCILKPVDGHGGDGVLVLRANDSNVNALIELTTRNGRELVVVQQMVPEAKLGDKRIILLNGEPLGAILRVPKGGEHRGNIHVGGSVQPAELTPRDLVICDTLRPYLKRHGLYFVGIDVLGDYLSEVNVTSPTGIQEMSRFDDVRYSERVIKWLEKQIATIPGRGEHMIEESLAEQPGLDEPSY